MITPLAAAKAYASAQRSSSATEGVSAGGGSDFGDMLKGVLEQATQSSKGAETQMAAQVQGKAELVDVVTSVAAAEASLETVLAVRDQVIAAYQEIMRLPI